MSLKSLLAAGVLALAVPGLSQATTLGGNLTADNAFFAYLGTSASTLGTLIASGNSWPTTFSLASTPLAPGATYYLQIEAVNYGGPSGFIGDFTLSDTNGHFANGAQEILTNTVNWTGNYIDGDGSVTPQPWTQPTGTVVSYGASGVGPWGGVSGVNAAAQWIWPSDGNGCGSCTVALETTITTLSPVPLPASLLMFGSAMVGLSGWGLRKSRRRVTA